MQNDGTEPLQLFKLRYYYLIDASRNVQSAMWDPSTLPTSIVMLPSGQSYLEVDFQGNTTLQAGESLRWGNGILFGLHYSDWSAFPRNLNPQIALFDQNGNAIQGSIIPLDFQSSSSVETSSSSSISETLPSIPVCWSEFAYLADQSLVIGDRSMIRSASIRSHQSIVLGFDSKVDSSAYSISNLILRDRARMGGNAYTGGVVVKGYGSSVAGQVKEGYEDFSLCSISEFEASVGVGTISIEVSNWSTKSIAPGRYDRLDVKSGATAILTSGDYFMSNLILQPDAKIKLAKGTTPIRLWIAGSYDLGDRSKVLFEGDSLPRRLQIFAFGTASNRIGFDAMLYGSFASPFADLRQCSRASVMGGIVARNITIEPDSKMQWVSDPNLVQNKAPQVQVSSITLGYGTRTELNTTHLNVEDEDTPAEYLYLNLSTPPSIGSLLLDGAVLATGAKVTFAMLQQGRISYFHSGNGAGLSDTLTFTLVDGVHSQRIQIPIHVLLPAPPQVQILYPSTGLETDSAQITILWTLNGQPISDIMDLVWGENKVTRQSTDIWGRTGFDYIIVNHPNRVKILEPLASATVTGFATVVHWTVDGVLQPFDTLESLVPGKNTIIRRAVRNGLLVGEDTVVVTSLGHAPSPHVEQPDTRVQTTSKHYLNAFTKGDFAVQKSIQDGALQKDRVAFVRGRVLHLDGSPFVGALVQSVDQKGLGFTTTDSTGYFVFTMNGGYQTAIEIAQKGYLAVQRSFLIASDSWMSLEDVYLTPQDTIATRIEFSSQSQVVQVARSTPQSDHNSIRVTESREARVFVLPGTQASLVYSDGNALAVDHLTLRTTEFTVGENGPKAMPGDLPPLTAYTYAAEFSAEEAGQAKAIQFSKPVPIYVDNFLHFPVGTSVPCGWYDRNHAEWVASENGVVIQLLSDNNDVANIDVNGDGIAETEAVLLAAGITEAERRALLQQYPIGKTLWRMPVQHFSVYDFNPMYGPPPGSPGPPPPDSLGSDTTGGDGGCKEEGCIIDSENQSIVQVIDVAGLPFSLKHNSLETNGNGKTDRFVVKVKDSRPLPSFLRRATVAWSILGQKFQRHFFLPNIPDTVVIQWDGKDAFGNNYAGLAPLEASVAYYYDETFLGEGGMQRSFGELASQNAKVISNIVNGALVEAKSTVKTLLSTQPINRFGFMGWTFEGMRSWDAGNEADAIQGAYKSGQAVHIYPEPSQIKYLIRIDSLNSGGWYDYSTGNGFSAVRSTPDGSLWGFGWVLATGQSYSYPSIIRFTPDGKDTTILRSGSGYTLPHYADGDSVINPNIYFYAYNGYQFEVNPQGELFFHTEGFYQDPCYIMKVGLDGRFHKINVPSPDGQPYGWIADIAIDPKGHLLVLFHNYDHYEILRLVDGRPPMVLAHLENSTNPRRLASEPNGSILVDSYNNGGYLLRLHPNGFIDTLIGASNGNYPVRTSAPARKVRYIDSFAKPVSTGDAIYFYGDCGNSGNTGLYRYTNGFVTHVAGCGRERIDEQLSDTLLPGPRIDAFDYSLSNTPFTVTQNHQIVFASSSYLLVIKDAKPIDTLGAYQYQYGTDGLAYGYDSLYRLHVVVDPQTHKLQREYQWNEQGYLISMIDYRGADSGFVTQFSMDSAKSIWTITPPSKQSTQIHWNFLSGNIDSVVDPMGGRYAMRYDSNHRIVSFTHPNQRIDSIAYNEKGELIYDGDTFGTGKVLSRTLKGDTSITLVQTPEKRIRKYIRIKPGDGRVTRWIVSENGDTTRSVEDAISGRSQVNTSDGVRQISWLKKMPLDIRGGQYLAEDSIVYPSGAVSTWKRTLESTPSGIYDRQYINGKQWTTTTDLDSYTRYTTSPELRQHFQTLDSNLRVLVDSVPGQLPSKMHYNAYGFVDTIWQELDSAGFVKPYATVLQYDSTGLLSSITDAYGLQHGFQYDAKGRVSKTTRQDTVEYNFAYDLMDNTIALTLPGQNQHQFAYDDHDRDTTYTPPSVLGHSISLQKGYDQDGLLQWRRFASGDTMTVLRDAGGRITGFTDHFGKTTLHYLGKDSRIDTLQRVTNSTSKLAYTYDGSRMLSETSSGVNAGKVAWNYWNDGKVKNISVGSLTFSYTYDQDGFPLTAGALTMVRDENTGALSTSTLGVVKAEQSYNRNGRLDTLRWRIGGNITRQWSYTYNALGRIVQIVENQANSILDYRYYYTHNGQLSIVTLNGDTVSTYIYDANGNRLAHNGAMGVYDSQDRMVSYAGRSYNFDDNGSLVRVSGALHSTSFAYDLHGNLTHATLENGTEIDYEVDARNRRVGKRVNGVKVEGFLYQSQLRPIAWLDANGAIKATFVYGDRNHVPSYMTMGGVTYRLITDHLGSVRMVVNTATGAIAQEMDYDEFGNVVRNTTPGFQPFGFAGGLYDSHTGLVRFGARDYDPTTSRWTAKDPILFAGGQGNLYVYVGNDPVNKIDNSGRKSSGFGGWLKGQLCQMNSGISVSGFAGVGAEGGITISPNGSIQLSIGVGFGIQAGIKKGAPISGTGGASGNTGSGLYIKGEASGAAGGGGAVNVTLTDNGLGGGGGFITGWGAGASVTAGTSFELFNVGGACDDTSNDSNGKDKDMNKDKRPCQ